jgi:phosphatidate cytidylyltransferase
MNSLPIRVISAIIAILILSAFCYFLEVTGLHILSYIAVLLGGRELVKILFQPSDSVFDKLFFYFCLLLIFFLSICFFESMALVYVLVSLLFFSQSLWSRRLQADLNPILNFQNKHLLGFFYVGLLPVFADRLLYLTHGMIWYLTLLAVVFTGDSFAFIFGVTLGKRKIMPIISPKKSTEGAFGGLLGTVVAALISHHFLPHVPVYALGLMGLAVGIFAQFGDFFESLLKRVADVKDSGSIMPGHGGVLDRLDGVLFAAPFVYLTALIFEKIAALH